MGSVGRARGRRSGHVTGCSSLRYLDRYPTDTLEIDRSFVEGLCCDDRTPAIVELIIQLATALGVGVVAGGVETKEQAEPLASKSCTFA